MEIITFGAEYHQRYL